MHVYDAIIIGTGQAGPSLAAALAASGQKVAIIERKRFGGTCVNNGCTPTKTLVASARNAHMARRAADYGVEITGDIKVNMQQVKARKDKIVEQSSTGVENWLKNTDNLSVYEGHGRFTDPHTVVVNDEYLRADKIFINVGGRARVNDHVSAAAYFTNSTIMEVDFVPQHLVIVGGSYIGLEFGQIYRRFGSEVTVIEMGDRLLRREDEDVSQSMAELLEAEGINLRLRAECIKATQEGDTVRVDVICEEGDPEVRGSHLLVAIGRDPNTHDLGLEQAGIDTNERGFIITDELLKTSQPHIWALGDCNGRGAFTHTAYNDYEIVANQLLGDGSRKASDRILNYALFTDPPLARIGMSEQEARKSGKKVLIGSRPMSRIARAKEKGETHGFIKILVDADSELILGATIVGIDGDEIIHSLLDMMYARQPYTVIKNAVHIHPTVSELIPTILGELMPLE